MAKGIIVLTEEPVISVGILTDTKIVCELYGSFKVPGIKQDISGIISLKTKGENIVCTYNNQNFTNPDEMIFIPADPFSESFLIRDVIIGIDFHWQRKEIQRFNHSLKVIRKGDKLIAINNIPLENYIESVISSEMSAKCSLQSLKAQAIVSRSWLIAQLERIDPRKTESESAQFVQSEYEIIKWYDRKQHEEFDVCADDHCQRFQGITKVTTENVRQAVLETRGIVLLHNNNVCDTRYSKSCGGITEGFENVWEPVKYPYLESIIDYKYVPENYNLDFSDETNARKWITGNPSSYCNTVDKNILSQILIDYDQETTNFFRWRITYSQTEIAKIIREKTNIDFGKIKDLVPVERGASARLIKLKIVGTKKSLTIGKELEIRRVLSTRHLYSSAIVFDKIMKDSRIPERFILRGSGWGHGVGLCQVGAAVMAEKGYEFDEILQHYFSGTDLKKIY
ncbi:MAG: SpoIID/LytB domain-containing protein [Ignavibacteria bacterium]